MRRLVVALACAATLAGCKEKKRDECAALVAVVKGAHTSLAGASGNAPDASVADQAGRLTSVANTSGGASDSIRALAGTFTTSSVKSVALDYADVLKDTSEAARAVPPVLQKLAALDHSIRASQASTLWTTALTEVAEIRQRCTLPSPPHACAYVVPRVAPVESLATDADALAKLAGSLEAAPRDDQAFWVAVYNFQGSIRVVSNSLRAVTNQTIEKRATESDLVAAKAKLDAGISREPAAEGAVEAACAP